MYLSYHPDNIRPPYSKQALTNTPVTSRDNRTGCSMRWVFGSLPGTLLGEGKGERRREEERITFTERTPTLYRANPPVLLYSILITVSRGRFNCHLHVKGRVIGAQTRPHGS